MTTVVICSPLAVPRHAIAALASRNVKPTNQTGAAPTSRPHLPSLAIRSLATDYLLIAKRAHEVSILAPRELI